MKRRNVKLIAMLFSILLAINFSSKSQCVNAGSDLFICVDKFGEIDTTTIKATNSIDSLLSYRWKCEYWYAGQTKFTASDFMEDTTIVQAKISKLDVVDNEDEVVFILEAYDSSGVVHCSDSMVVTFSKFGAIFLPESIEINQGDTSQIYTASGNGIKPLTYKWEPNYNISDTTVEMPSVWPDTTTIYDCIVTDSVGCVSGYSDEWEIVVKTVSVPELAKKNVKLTIYPNPINENTTVQVSSFTDFTAFSYQLIDLKGRLIKSDQLSSEVNLGSVINSSGIYFFNVYYKGELIKMEKLIKR